MIYLDNAATSYKKPLCVLHQMLKSTMSSSANAGRGGHRLSINTMNKIFESAESVASLFGIDNPENIAFTQNATLALNMAISGILSQGGHAIVTQMEHNSILRPVHKYGNYTVIKANKYGFINPDDIEEAIRSDTRLIVCTHASNVSGSIQPIKKISKITKRHNIPFLVDAAQSAGCYPINISDLGADMLAFSGHKGIMGPLGTGGLYVNSKIKLNPIISGGTGSNSESMNQPDFLPDMLHSGTLNAPAIITLGSACNFIKKQTPQKIHERELTLALNLIEDLSEIKGVKVYGSTFSKNRNATVAFNIKNVSPTEVSEHLDKSFNIVVRSGFHCAPLAHKALDTGKEGCVRASFGFYNNKKDEKALVKAIESLTK